MQVFKIFYCMIFDLFFIIYFYYFHNVPSMATAERPQLYHETSGILSQNTVASAVLPTIIN